ncbi:hypothetical protein FGO68_gene3395 [Halteria grandinella]|uniref:HMG box domain-containing protein n=1 Tax=Halteria grandinella TaxID=5974 RepID=A0A8J8T4R5_HALGN|nr:hypothetical protein FGO68_gene3395 [Halteria grandinella]
MSKHTVKALEKEAVKDQKLLSSQLTENDKSPPKRPLSPYIYFSQTQRKILKNLHPTWQTRQVMRVINQKWKRMSKQEKQDYQLLSDEDRRRYLIEINLLKRQGGGGQAISPQGSSE